MKTSKTKMCKSKIRKNINNSLLAQSLQYVIIKHNLVQQMPISNKFWTKYFKHCCFVTSIINSIISSNIFACSDACLAYMF